jgi:hypothetical protein
MEEVIPELKEDLRMLTRHYVSTRYGGWFPSVAEQAGIRQSWQRIRRTKIKRRRTKDTLKGENK